MRFCLLLCLTLSSSNIIAGPCEDIEYLVRIAHSSFREIQGNKIQKKWEIEGSTDKEFKPAFILEGADSCKIKNDHDSATYECRWITDNDEQLNSIYNDVVNQLHPCLSTVSNDIRQYDKGYRKTKRSVTYFSKSTSFDIGEKTSVYVNATSRQSLRTMKKRKYLKVSVSYYR